MEKQILSRGYVTYSLTDEDGKIYGFDNSYYNWETIESSHLFYWSEVYCEAGHLATILRKGKLLVNPTAEELSNYHNQSKINCN